MSVAETPPAASDSREGVSALYVPAFDGIRGFVSLSIALVHVQLAVDYLPDSEALGALRGSWFFSIEFLFLLGGFVAFLPLAHYGRFAGIRSYALRRAGRLLPLYYVTLVLAVVLGGWLRPVVGVSDSFAPHDLGAVLIHVVFLQQELLAVSGFGVQGIVWTMSIVAAFYVLFPLVARAYLRWPVLGLLAALMVSVAWRTLVDDPRAFRQFPLFLVDFAIGMTAAHVFVLIRRRGGLGERTALALGGMSLVALPVLLYVAGLPIARDGVRSMAYWHEAVWLSVTVPAVFALLLVVVPFAPRWARWPVDNPVARWIGEVSYGLFLFHFLVIWSVLGLVEIPRDGSRSSAIELTLLVIPLTLVMAWLGTKFIERPLRDRAQRLAERSRREREAALDAPAAVPATTR